VSPVAGAVDDGFRLTRGGAAAFPQRSFLLSLPEGTSAEATGIRVFENGAPVHELEVVSAGSSSPGQLGTVLAIDASNSMRGAPIRRAMAAARSFATHRRPSQKLGVVAFNRFPRTILEPTIDGERIDAALAKPPRLATQTHLRDGALSGIEALERARVSVGSVIVLSDGADTGSRASTAAVAGIARERGVRVFTVGLKSRRFDQRTLTQLAQASGGEYLAAPSPDDLERIYDDLGAKLAGEYLVRYSSVIGPGKRVHVEAAAQGVAGEATLNYRSPKIAPAPLPVVEPKADGFWGSSGAMVAVAFGTAFLVCFLVAAVAVRRRRDGTAEERVAAFVAMGSQQPEPVEGAQQDKLYDRLEHGLGGRDWWRRFVLDVDVARIPQKPARIVVFTGLITLFVMWLFATISAAWVAVFALLIPWGVRRYIGHQAHRQRLLFGEQLADNLQVIASAMRAGQSFGSAIAVAVEDAPEPAKREFQRVVADERLGTSLETSLGAIVERMDNRDLHQVALVAALQRQAGGNAAEVLDRVSDTIRERVALRRLISTLTAQGRLSRWVVSLVPVGLIMFIGLTKPDYLDPLTKTAAGNALIVLAAVMGVAGSLVMKRIADIKV
jgi:tight adherence protein B